MSVFLINKNKTENHKKSDLFLVVQTCTKYPVALSLHNRFTSFKIEDELIKRVPTPLDSGHCWEVDWSIQKQQFFDQTPFCLRPRAKIITTRTMWSFSLEFSHYSIVWAYIPLPKFNRKEAERVCQLSALMGPYKSHLVSPPRVERSIQTLPPRTTKNATPCQTRLVDLPMLAKGKSRRFVQLVARKSAISSMHTTIGPFHIANMLPKKRQSTTELIAWLTHKEKKSRNGMSKNFPSWWCKTIRKPLRWQHSTTASRKSLSGKTRTSFEAPCLLLLPNLNCWRPRNAELACKRLSTMTHSIRRSCSAFSRASSEIRQRVPFSQRLDAEEKKVIEAKLPPMDVDDGSRDSEFEADYNWGLHRPRLTYWFGQLGQRRQRRFQFIQMLAAYLLVPSSILSGVACIVTTRKQLKMSLVLLRQLPDDFWFKQNLKMETWVKLVPLTNRPQN